MSYEKSLGFIFIIDYDTLCLLQYERGIITDNEEKIIGLLELIIAGQARLETRMDKLEARMDKLEARMDKLEARMDKLEARMDKLETDLADFKTEMADFKAEMMDFKSEMMDFKDRQLKGNNMLTSSIMSLHTKVDNKIKVLDRLTMNNIHEIAELQNADELAQKSIQDLIDVVSELKKAANM